MAILLWLTYTASINPYKKTKPLLMFNYKQSNFFAIINNEQNSQQSLRNS